MVGMAVEEEEEGVEGDAMEDNEEKTTQAWIQQRSRRLKENTPPHQ